MAADQDRPEDPKLLAAIVDSIPDMIFVKDAEHLRFVLFNAAGEALLGTPREDLQGKSDHDLFPTEEATFFVAKDREALAAGAEQVVTEEPIHTPDGERWLHTRKVALLGDDGEPRYLLGISRDITEQRRTAAALTASERRLKILREQFPGLLLTTNGEGRIESVDGAAAVLFGLEDAVGSSVSASLDRFTDRSLDQLLETARETGSAACELRCVDRILECRVTCAAEDVLTFAALDVTEKRRLEASRIEAQVQERQKLESLGILAGGIAHDFNNLLVGVLGNVTLAQAALAEHSPAAPALERIERASQRAADLTRQMLAYSGRGRFVVKQVDLREVIREMTGLLDVSTSERASIVFDFPDELPRVQADVAQIQQVMMNLITNAADAVTPGRGRIHVVAESVEADPDYLSSSWAGHRLEPGTYVAVEVSDNGAGMDAATRDRMFDPFFTTKPTGHGLGLSATLGIVRGHGGAIRVYSEVGRGTAVKVLLPASDAPPADHAPSRTEVAEGEALRVLVVDDDDDIREFVRAALEFEGCHVVEAADGATAVDRVEGNPDGYDVVLLDLTMPGLSGEETFRRLRAIHPDLRVVLSSGYNEQESVGRFAGRGLAGFLQKPYTRSDLLQALRGPSR